MSLCLTVKEVVFAGWMTMAEDCKLHLKNSSEMYMWMSTFGLLLELLLTLVTTKFFPTVGTSGSMLSEQGF